MEKLLEKKNLGIPSVIVILLAYFIGYYFTADFTGLLVAVIFGLVVFAFNFDEAVRFAVKQSYIIGLLFSIVYLGLDMLYQISEVLTPPDYSEFILQAIFSNIHRYAAALFKLVVILIYAVFLIATLLKKELRLSFISSILGEKVNRPQQPVPGMYQPMQARPMGGQPLPPNQQPLNQQPGPIYQQPAQMYQQPGTPEPMKPLQPSQPPADITCVKCGRINHHSASFCVTCGNKL